MSAPTPLFNLGQCRNSSATKSGPRKWRQVIFLGKCHIKMEVWTDCWMQTLWDKHLWSDLLPVFEYRWYCDCSLTGCRVEERIKVNRSVCHMVQTPFEWLTRFVVQVFHTSMAALEKLFTPLPSDVVRWHISQTYWHAYAPREGDSDLWMCKVWLNHSVNISKVIRYNSKPL